MSFEILHFRGSENILKERKLLKDVESTMEYLDDVLCGSLYRREILRQALDEMGWRTNGSLAVLEGRRYQYKGFKRDIAIEGNFSAYEYILEGLLRLQIGYDRQRIMTGILMLTAQRSEKTPYGNTAQMVTEEMDLLYPTISLPVTVVLFDLGRPFMPEEAAAYENDEDGRVQPGGETGPDES